MLMEGVLIQNSRASWSIGTSFESCIVVGTPMDPWSIGNEHVISIGLNLWTNTQSNKSNQRCGGNTRSCAMNRRMLLRWRKWMFAMQLSSRVVDVTGLQELNNWLNFRHFCVRQWGGFMIQVIFSSFPTHFPSHSIFMACLHNSFGNDVMRHILCFVEIHSEGACRHAHLQPFKISA